MFAGWFWLAAVGERFGPAELRSGFPEAQAVLAVKAAGERELRVGVFVAAQRRVEQREVHARVSVPRDAVPDELVGIGLEQLVQHPGGLARAGLRGGVRVRFQRAHPSCVVGDVSEVLGGGAREYLGALRPAVDEAVQATQPGLPSRDARV